MTGEYCKKNGAPWQVLVLVGVVAASSCSHPVKVTTVAPATESPVVLTVKSEALACGALSDEVATMLGPPNTMLVRAAASMPSTLEPAVLSALALCEQVLLKTKGLQVGNGSLIEALVQSSADPEEISGYAGLLTRYAQQGGMRRWLYYGPKLAKLFQAAFDRRASSVHCGRTVREFAFFLQTAPPPLGGDLRRGLALQKSECVNESIGSL